MSGVKAIVTSLEHLIGSPEVEHTKFDTFTMAKFVTVVIVTD